MCYESSGRFSDSEHFAVVSVGMCKMVGIRGHSIKHHIMCFCVFLQADSRSEFAFQGTCVFTSLT